MLNRNAHIACCLLPGRIDSVNRNWFSMRNRIISVVCAIEFHLFHRNMKYDHMKKNRERPMQAKLTIRKKNRFTDRQRKKQFKWLNATWFLERKKINRRKTCWLYKSTTWIQFEFPFKLHAKSFSHTHTQHMPAMMKIEYFFYFFHRSVIFHFNRGMYGIWMASFRIANVYKTSK